MSFFQPWLLGGLGKKKKKKVKDTHRDGIRHKHDQYDQQEAKYVIPGPLQGGSDHVHLGVESEQVPQFDGGEQDQEGDQVLERQVCFGCIIKTGKSTRKQCRLEGFFIIVICEGIYPRYWHVPLVIHSQVYSSESVSWHLILTCTCSFGWSLCGLISPLKGALDMTGRKTDCVL